MSAILRPLGHVELATALSELVHTPFRKGEAAARQRVEQAFASNDVRSVGRRSDGHRDEGRHTRGPARRRGDRRGAP
jgi:hypothetical protein